VNGTTGILKKYFGVVASGQAYLNILYLLLALPLGTLYFTFLVTGLSVGIGTLIVWIGIPILLLVFASSWWLAVFERWLAMGMLGQDIGPMSNTGTASGQEVTSPSVWERLKAHLSNPVTWKSLLYLLLKLPVGIFTFTAAVTLVSVSVSMLIAPIIYPLWDYPYWWGTRRVDTLGEALVVALLAALIVGPVSLHIMNLLAAASGWLARVMLGAAQHSASASDE
jgi:hypothetical protein